MHVADAEWKSIKGATRTSTYLYTGSCLFQIGKNILANTSEGPLAALKNIMS